MTNELKINNCVDVINRSNEVHLPRGIELRVIEINIFEVKCIPYHIKPHKATKDEVITIDACDLSPIRITEDWAVKFGYECLLEMANDFYDESRYHVEIRVDDLEGLKVHEAQNLFYALSGKELTIK